LLALGWAHDLLLQARWTSADLGKIVRGATEAFDNPDLPRFSIDGPSIQITSAAVIAIAMNPQRALHQHDEIWRAVGADWPRRNCLDGGRIDTTVASHLE
jgi:hypothetical protein